MVIADLLGFDPDAHDDLLRWSDDLMRATTARPDARAGPGRVRGHDWPSASSSSASSPSAGPSPRDDLITKLCQAEVDGDGLDDESIVNETLLILIGGDETTRHVMSGGMLALLERPDQLAALTADPERLPVAVEELLRWVSPIKNMSRTVTQDVELRGQRAARRRPGDALLPVGQPRRGRLRRTRTGSTSGATPTRTWPSASAPTSASARRWPGWSSGSCSARCWPASPTSRLADAADLGIPCLQLRQRSRVDAGPLHPALRCLTVSGAAERACAACVELGAWVAGPGAGGILADWGADVVKIEPPEGDPAATSATCSAATCRSTRSSSWTTGASGPSPSTSRPSAASTSRTTWWPGPTSSSPTCGRRR